MFEVSWEELALFLQVDKNQSQKSGAVQAHRSRFRVLTKWFSNKEWSRSNFRAFLAETKERGLGQESINKYISLGHYIDEYLNVEETKSFKTRVAKPPKIEAVLTPAEIKAMAELEYPYKKYKDFLNKRQQALIMLMGLSGCRISEPLELKWKNIMEFPVKHLVFLDTKNGEDREVWLDDDLWELIQAIPRKNEFVFASARGGVLKSGEINTDIQRRAKMLGIKKRVYNHLFRHSLATTLGELGLADSDIAKIIGWKDPKMLMRYKNSQLSHYASLMQLHPLLQHKMSYQERSQRLEKEAVKLFDPRTHKIATDVDTKKGEIVLKISSNLSGLA